MARTFSESTRKPGRVALAAQNDKFTIGPAALAQCLEIAVYVTFNVSSTQGVISIESADDENFTGTWAVVGTVTWAGAANKQFLTQVTGVNAALRARVTTAVDGSGAHVTFVGRG